MEIQNKNPQLHSKFELSEAEKATRHAQEMDPNHEDPIDTLEIFDIIREILDPEHPLTLEQLNVVSLEDTLIQQNPLRAEVYFTPTIPNCSSASLIGLIIYIKLKECLPSGFKFRVKIKPGSHDLEEAINKQLADKERISAAFENERLRQSIRQKVVDEDVVRKFLAAL